MYNVHIMKNADKIEKQMGRYIKMMTVMSIEVFEELKKRGWKIDVIEKRGWVILVVIYRK